MYPKSKQLSLGDIYEECKYLAENDKPEFLDLLEKHLNLSELIPFSFYTAYYAHYGRSRKYSLESMLSALILQKILGLDKVSQLLDILKLSSDIRDYCGFNSVPDQSQFTRLKQQFEEHIKNFFDHLVDLTEPICEELNEELANTLLFDTSGIKAYVSENNPKFINTLIRRMKNYYKDNPDVDVYKMAYNSMPSSASVSDEIKQLYINGHFCYVYKFSILTNAMGIVRDISFLDKDFKKKHPEIKVDKKSDSPDEDKSIGDSNALKPVLNDYFYLHPDFTYNIFIGDSAFDNYKTYPFLLNDCEFDKALIPLNERNKSDLPQPSYNENGWPMCPKDVSLAMEYNGHCNGKNRSPRDKWVCPKTHFENEKRVCHCEDPCTDSTYGRVTYTYPDQDLRTYPGLIRGTQEWEQLFKLRGSIEQTINYFKEPMGVGNPKTQNRQTIKSDLYLAGITQLITLIVANNINKPENIRSLKSLIT